MLEPPPTQLLNLVISPSVHQEFPSITVSWALTCWRSLLCSPAGEDTVTRSSHGWHERARCRCLGMAPCLYRGQAAPCSASWQSLRKELRLLVRIFSFSRTQSLGKAPCPSFFTSFCPVSRPQTSSVSFLCQTIHSHKWQQRGGRRVES